MSAEGQEDFSDEYVPEGTIADVIARLDRMEAKQLDHFAVSIQTKEVQDWIAKTVQDFVSKVGPLLSGGPMAMLAKLGSKRGDVTDGNGE